MPCLYIIIFVSCALIMQWFLYGIYTPLGIYGCCASLKKEKPIVEELIEILNEIVKYGLNPNVEIKDKEKDLEINLVKLYSKYFEINYQSDENEYKDFNKKETYPNVIENVKSNFKDFGWYHSILNLEEILKEPETGTGDAIDDLSDIIYDLLEIKYRKENNSENDAWRFFELIFCSHTQQHLIDLINYLKNKNG